jgi:hypothetical protein
MPGSTYSTNLKIELIADGEQSGNWGGTTNINLGTALEQAIVGYGNPNFTTDADLTITLTDDNATQVARNFALNVTSTGSLTTTRNLIVPTIQKSYLIRNNTTGTPSGQSIVVKTSAGTGVTVANGTYMLVYADGTNVVPQISQLPVLYGGTGATTAADARTSLGVPANSGTGATGAWPITIAVTTSNGYGTRTVSISAPTGGADGDIWYQLVDAYSISVAASGIASTGSVGNVTPSIS